MKTRILYEDKDILVCFKPAGIAVQSARATEPDVVSELKGYLAGKGKTAVEAPGPMAGVRCGLPSGREPVYLGVIHRLDQPVSGILVFSKNRKAAAELSRQVADHSMEKVYRAQVWTDEASAVSPGQAKESRLDGRWNELTDYRKKDGNRTARIADPGDPEAKKAALRYRCLKQDGERALLEIELKTGRYHQIRLQLSHAGMPIAGDGKYSDERHRRADAGEGIRSIRLQAVKLCFNHPTAKKRVCYELDQKLEL